MKKTIKRFIMFALLLLLTGCSVEYNLNFEDNTLKENINVYLTGADYNNDRISNLKDFSLLAISKGLDQVEYNKDFIDDGNKFTAQYDYTYSIDDFSKNNVFSRCYNSFALTSGTDYYLLSTGKTFSCMSLDYQKIDSYTINIKSNHKVLESNADEVKNGIYTWKIINSESETDVQKPIIIKFSKYGKADNDLIDKNIKSLLIILLAFLVIGGIIILVIYNKSQKNKRA